MCENLHSSPLPPYPPLNRANRKGYFWPLTGNRDLFVLVKNYRYLHRQGSIQSGAYLLLSFKGCTSFKTSLCRFTLLTISKSVVFIIIVLFSCLLILFFKKLSPHYLPRFPDQPACSLLNVFGSYFKIPSVFILE